VKTFTDLANSMGIINFITQPAVSWLNHQRPPRRTPLSDYERIRHEIKQCDVMLIEGRSRVSDVVKMVTQSPWSHAALYLGRLHDIDDPELRQVVTNHYDGDPADQLIIESELGHGTKVRPLEIYKDDHARICRPSGLEYQDTQKVIRYAISRLGTDYDVRQIIDLARFLFPWAIMPRRWRSSLFSRMPGRSTRTVCSTMIAESFGFVQFPILPLVKQDDGTVVQLFRRNPKLCTPRDFDYSPYFEIIKYPFMDFSHHSSYRLLPWRGTNRLQGDESDLYLDQDEEHSSADVDQAIEQALLISEDASGSKNLREDIPIEDPAAGVPAAGDPVAGIPAADVSAAGETTAGDPAASVSDADDPAVGTPETDTAVESEPASDGDPKATNPAAGIPVAGAPAEGVAVDEKNRDADPLGNF
jgi:hypothetical protein